MIRKYMIWFDICGKKLITTIEAKSPDHAEYLLRCKLKIDKVQRLDDPQEDAMRTFEHLKNTIFGEGKNE